MLQSMRQLAHSWVVKGLMLLLMVSFSIWGIGDIFRGNPLQKTVVKAGNTEISVQELNRLFAATLAQARQRVSPNLTAQQAKQMGLLDKALENEINRALVDQDIKKLGLNVSREEVLKRLADQPQFRNKDGSFNKDLFRQLLQQQGLSETGFLTQGQQDLARQILLGALEGSHSVPQTAVDALYKARAQKRILDVITVDATKIESPPMGDDKTLHAFYENNPAPFTAPEYRGITVASLSTSALEKDISISDEQLKKEYDEKHDQFAVPEKRDIVQSVLQDEEQAKKLVKQARASGNLTAAAKAAKVTAIPLNQMEEKGLMPDLAKLVFALHEGDIGDPVKTQLGWHVVQVKKITPAGTPSFEAIKDKLRDDMRRDQAVEAATRIVNQLDDQLAAGHSLDDIADELKLRLVKIPGVDANGLMPNGKEAPELPNKEQVLKDAFAQSAGEASPVEDNKDGNYYVVRTDDIIPSSLKAFDSVKPSVIAAWKTHEQIAKAQAEADKIAKGLRDGKEADSFANGVEISVRTSSPLSQLGDRDAALPPDLAAQAFKLKKGETATTLADKKQIVIQLADIDDVDMSKPDPRKNQIEGEIRKNTGDELLDQYVAYLRQIFPVKTDAALLDHLRQQDN